MTTPIGRVPNGNLSQVAGRVAAEVGGYTDAADPTVPALNGRERPGRTTR